MSSKFLKAVFLQFTGTVGAGIFSLPFALYSSNFYLSSLLLVVFGIVVAFVNQIYLDTIIATPGDHQLSGYSQIYLGSKFRRLAVINIFLLATGSLIAYITLASKFLPNIFSVFTPAIGSYAFVSLLLLFFLIHSPLVSILSFLIPGIIIFIPLLLLSTSISLPAQPIIAEPLSFLFVGPVLYSLSSFTIVPEVEEVLRHQNHRLRLASFVGTILSLAVYLVFSFAILRLTDGQVSPDTITGIALRSPLLASILSVFGLLAVFNASLNFLMVIKETLFRDFSVSAPLSFTIASLIPVLILFYPNPSFFQVIALTGGVTVFISVLLICLIRLHQKVDYATKKLIYAILAFFTFCLLATLFL